MTGRRPDLVASGLHDADPDPASETGSKTINTGLRLLEILRDHPDGLTITELARVARIHRNAVSRHLTALRNHRLVARSGTKYALGLGIVELNAVVQQRLRTASATALQDLADTAQATAFVTVLDNGREAVVLMVAEPRGSHFHVAYRPGNRHPADQGAAGIAILAGRPPVAGERAAITRARLAGYSVTSGELQPGAWGVAVPIGAGRRTAEASVGVVAIGERDERDIAPLVLAAATRIGRLL